jgi:hypothetical protein
MSLLESNQLGGTLVLAEKAHEAFQVLNMRRGSLSLLAALHEGMH